MMIKPFLTVTICVALVGCGGFSGIGSKSGGKRAETENKLPFKAKLSAVSDDRANFTVQIANEGKGIAEIRESARFEGTKYCLFTNGSSDINWTLDEQTGDWAAVQDGSALIVSGRCVGR